MGTKGVNARRAGFGLLLATVGLLAVTGAAQAAAPAHRSGDPAEDARTVYCLDPTHAADVTAAAIVLGEARTGPDAGHIDVDGDSVTLRAWHAEHPDRFDRACAATIAAAGADLTTAEDTPNPVLAALAPILPGLVPGLVGALLAAQLTARQDSRAREREQAVELRDAARDLRRASTSHLAAATGSTGDTVATWEEADQAVQTMRSRLLKVGARHRRWPLPGELVARLETGTFGPRSKVSSSPDHWNSWEIGARRTQAAAIRRRVDSIGADVERIAGALEQPRRLRRTVTRAPERPDSTDGPPDVATAGSGR